MAANYSGPGTATDPVDLLKNKILAWLLAQGWTQDMSQVDGSGWRVHVHKGSLYVHLRAFVNESTVWASGMTSAGYGIALYCGSGFNGAVAWNLQAGGPLGNGTSNNVGVGIQLPAGAVTTTHFFDDGSDNIEIVVERSAGVYGHLGWGKAAQPGAGTAQPYFLGSLCGYYIPIASAVPGATLTAFCPGGQSDALGCTAGFIKTDVDSFTGKWLGFNNQTTAGFQGYTGKNAFSVVPANQNPVTGIPGLAALISRATSSLNQQPNLLPIQIHAARDAGGYSPIATIPSVFFANATAHGFAAGSVYAIGGTNYMLFPYFAVVKGS